MDPTSQHFAPATAQASGSSAKANPNYKFVNWTLKDSTTPVSESANFKPTMPAGG